MNPVRRGTGGGGVVASSGSHVCRGLAAGVAGRARGRLGRAGNGERHGKADGEDEESLR